MANWGRHEFAGYCTGMLANFPYTRLRAIPTLSASRFIELRYVLTPVPCAHVEARGAA